MRPILLFKKPVGWLVGGAKWGNTRIHGKKVSPRPNNLFDGPEPWTTGDWTDNGDGSFTILDDTVSIVADRWVSKNLGAKVVTGETYTLSFKITVRLGGGAVNLAANDTLGVANNTVDTFVEDIVAGAGNRSGCRSNGSVTDEITVSDLIMVKK